MIARNPYTLLYAIAFGMFAASMALFIMTSVSIPKLATLIGSVATFAFGGILFRMTKSSDKRLR